jgi:hypothetical protein
MSIIYFFLFLWAKVFCYDIENDDLFVALMITDVLIVFIFALKYSFKEKGVKHE